MDRIDFDIDTDPVPESGVLRQDFGFSNGGRITFGSRDENYGVDPQSMGDPNPNLALNLYTIESQSASIDGGVEQEFDVVLDDNTAGRFIFLVKGEA